MLRQRGYIVEENEPRLEYLLKDVGTVLQIGTEKGRKKADGISKYVSPYGSYRYVLYVKGEAIGALQVMSRGGNAIASNVFVANGHRRRGHADRLLKMAKKDFNKLVLSKGRSRSGAAWAVQHESVVEDEQQRQLRAGVTDDNMRLPNVHRVIPAYRMKNVPYRGQAKVTIYRGIAKSDTNRIIRPGDWVALKKGAVKRLPGRKILQREVNAYDIVWAGTDETEWFYSPMRGMK